MTEALPNSLPNSLAGATTESHAVVRAWFSAHLAANPVDRIRALCVAGPQLHSVIGSLIDPSEVRRIHIEDVLRRVHVREITILDLQGDEQLVASRWSTALHVRPDDASATPPATDEHAAAATTIIEGTTWFRLEHSLIAEIWEHWDCEPLLARPPVSG